MQHKTLKLSALAVLIAGATGANAAVYRVVEIEASTDTQIAIDKRDYYNEVDLSELSRRLAFYGQGIAASSGQNCFVDACDDGEDVNDPATDFSVFGESRFGADGINYRDEVPFILDNLQRINDEDNLYRYCDSNLGPNTCREWARTQYYGNGYNTNDVGDRSGFGGLVREQEAWSKNFFSNATAISGFRESGLNEITTFADSESGYEDVVSALGSIVDSSNHKTTNSVINAQGTSAVGDYVLGISSGAYFDDGQRYARQFNKRGFVNLGDNKVGLAPAGSDSLTTTAGQSLAWDAVEYNNQLLVVGSASYDRSSFNDTDNKVPDNYGDRGDPTFNEGTYRDCPKTFEEKGLESFYATKECQLSVFANDGVFWTLDGSTSGNVEAQLLAKNDLATLDPDENDRSFQAGARAVELVNGQPVVVGFTTDRYDNDYYAMRASVWELPADATSASAESFERTLIPGLALESGGDRVLTYTLATDVNANNKVIGVAKNFRADNRSYVERMFVYDNAAKPDAPTFLNASISPIFFDGANGYPAAINNSNQIVGRLDSESVNQVDGRFRRQRAFTYAMGEIEGSAALKRGDAYFLDDLVNDGNTNGNANKYRIFEATGINDAGVISATAYKCEGGYDDLTTDSFCQGGEPGVERIVAVKLIPIAASDEPSVVERPESEASVERSGASLGMLAMAFLGFLGFRRRK
ncbi:DUF3466 domain-containing protein [Photobacterium gaetbulicola]|uniref:GlyGly-CTERM sorting domain-containing protein n=1 Tax=Photobacterium gaetbulicola Gung47 TaxID=658445 RepID=A0A0C5WZY2_9GAMM|nr:DUF3466 family protein [Photobacterium gaetbulicola]AJR08625.1 hypothetical protein H744_2c1961 [Photobacterium gaetbulicola Gung47]PSU02935.1 DUF3466 domain-containing protein [Photobacterium gaetbulicola]